MSLRFYPLSPGSSSPKSGDSCALSSLDECAKLPLCTLRRRRYTKAARDMRRAAKIQKALAEDEKVQVSGISLVISH